MGLGWNASGLAHCAVTMCVTEACVNEHCKAISPVAAVAVEVAVAQVAVHTADIGHMDQVAVAATVKTHLCYTKKSQSVHLQEMRR